ncbi:MAG: LytR C-terminal domain-containing protein [Candidatus Levybacteria bacterium]|nr:LytR C-terminal domain-containing protein [Candidatus Levybacteria bacterium]
MEDSSFQAPVSQLNYSSPRSSNRSKNFLYIIIFAILLIGIFLGAQKLFFSTNRESETAIITPTPTEFQFPTDTPTPSITPTSEPKPTATPTAKPITNPIDSATGLDRSTLSVEVQNGSGEAGVAAKGAEILKSFGYKIASTGNADNFDYQNTTIRVKSVKSNFLPLLKKDLGFSYTVGSTSADLSSDSTADVLVIIGK